MRPEAVFAALALVSSAGGAAAAPFAVTLANRETVQLVDLASVKRGRETVIYDHIMMVPPNPDLAGGRLSYIIERQEARCADGMIRRLDMAPVMTGEPPAPRMEIEGDPWAPGHAGVLDAVCKPAALPTVPTIERGRALMDAP